MDIVAEFARLARAAPKALCSPALMPFACGSAAVASEPTATTMAEMVSGAAGQRQHAWIALDFGTLHLVNVSAVCAQHCSKTPAHLLQVTSLAAPHPPCFQRLSSNCALGSEAAHVTNHFLVSLTQIVHDMPLYFAHPLQAFELHASLDAKRWTVVAAVGRSDSVAAAHAAARARNAAHPVFKCRFAICSSHGLIIAAHQPSSILAQIDINQSH